MEHNDRRKAKLRVVMHTQSISSKLETAIIKLSMLASSRLKSTGQEF